MNSNPGSRTNIKGSVRLAQDFMHEISYICYEYDIDLRNQSSALRVFCVSRCQNAALPPPAGYLWLRKLHIPNT
jgi:hypothetical protein